MTRVAVVGAHGQVGQRILNQLYVEGHEGVGLVRNADQGEDIVRLGGDAALLDLEQATPEELASAFEGADAVVFTAGAGAGSGADRKRTVDYGASVLSIEAAGLAGVRRFVQISAWGADDPLGEDADEVWTAYVAAKRDADAALRESDLDWTILRPGGLTNDPGTGLIELAPRTERGSIPREDVAATVLAVLAEPASIGSTWELVSGPTPIADAVARAAV